MKNLLFLMFIASTHVNAYTFKENTQYFNDGQATGCYNLGNAYNFGRGVEQNKSKAIYWYKKAAEKGIAQAAYNLGRMHYFGDGVEQNKSKAVYWYKKAAEQGFASAQYNLGGSFEFQVGKQLEFILEKSNLPVSK
jgi:TPR repeat protein